MTMTAIRPEAVAGGHTPAAPAPAIDFDSIVREHRRWMVASAYRRTENWHDAEDAVQDSLLKAWEQRGQFEPRDGSPPEAWVAHLAGYRAYQIKVARRRETPCGRWVEREAEEREDRPTDTGLRCMADPDVCAGAYAAIAELPDQQRLAIQMHCLQGMDRKAVRACLRVTDEKFWRLINAALKRLERRRRGGPAVAKVRTAAGAELNPQTVELCRRPGLLDKLRERPRLLMHLRYVKGLPAKEVAARMGIQVNSVNCLGSKAAARLRKLAVTA